MRPRLDCRAALSLCTCRRHYPGAALGRPDTLHRRRPRIELDNNTVERSIRPIALNRKNALFAGSSTGPLSPRSSTRANSATSTRSLTSPTSSPGSSTVIPTATSIGCCQGPTDSRTLKPWLENSAYAGKWNGSFSGRGLCVEILGQRWRFRLAFASPIGLLVSPANATTFD
jgi:Transposase IS66 family